MLGFVLVQQKRWTEAEKVLAALVSDHPEELDGLFHLGQAQAAQGKREAARSAFERVARETRSQDLARRAADELRRL
jgi:TolA-binding protein